MAAQADSEETGMRIRLTRRGAGVLAAGALGVIAFAVTDRSEFLACGVILIASVLLALATLAIVRPRLSVRRVLSEDIVAVGESITQTLRFHNLADRPSSPARWAEEVSFGLQAPEQAELPALDQRRLGEFYGPDSVVFRSEIRARRRGPGTVGPTVVFRRDPFGFASADYRIGTTAPILVTPRISVLADSEFGRAAGEGERVDLQAPASPSPDEVTARAYRPGDPLRRIHWRASARVDALMVRQEEERSTPRALVYLDVRREAAGADEERAERRFELAVELAASVAVQLAGAGYELSTIVSGPSAGPEYFLDGPGTGGQHPLGRMGSTGRSRLRFLSELAVVEPALPEAEDHLGDLQRVLGRSQVPIPVFAVVSNSRTVDAAGLAALARRADPPLAVLVDADPSQATGTARILGAGGWRCVVAAPDETAVSAWRRVVGTAPGTSPATSAGGGTGDV